VVKYRSSGSSRASSFSQSQTPGVDMKAQMTAACIFIGLTQQCLSDETLFTCRRGSSHLYTSEGGYSKPGWSVDEGNNVIKLIRKQPASGGFYDIQGTTITGMYSSLADGCLIAEQLEKGGHSLDLIFVVTCKWRISTYLFHRRSGVDQLLETHLGLFPDDTFASVFITKDCKQGD
jgi:hypothetical protein